MNQVETVNGSAYYEVELKRHPLGVSGDVYHVDGETRTLIGNTAGVFGGGFAVSRESVLTVAKRMATQHRDGNEVIRLELD